VCAFTVAAADCDDGILLEQLITAAEQYERVLAGTVQTGSGAQDKFLHFVTYYYNVQSKVNIWLMYSILAVHHISNGSSNSSSSSSIIPLLS